MVATVRLSQEVQHEQQRTRRCSAVGAWAVCFIRMSVGMQFMMSPPWEMNGVSHQVPYFNGLFNGPGWLSMIDTDLQKAKQR